MALNVDVFSETLAATRVTWKPEACVIEDTSQNDTAEENMEKVREKA